MIKYAKLIDNRIELAPSFKDNTFNYNLNEELMVQDGYKKLIEVERPLTNRMYHIEYNETKTKIEEVLVYDETQQEADDREANNREQYFKNLFFKVTLPETLSPKGYGYYRKQPKGYSSAIESITAAERICSKMNGLPAGVLIFYQEPDFYDETQITEEWLEQHQIVLPALDVEHFDQLFIVFIQAWNTKEHAEEIPQEQQPE